MRPKAIVTINGTPVAGLFWEKLVSLTVTDNEGKKADTIDLVLEDGPPFLAIPQKDDKISCWLGYEDGAFDFMGAFTVHDVEAECLPWKLNVKGKSADLKDSLKQHRRRNFDDKTFGDVAKQMAGEHGLEAQIDGEIANFKPDGKWFGQDNESDMHWLERWSGRLDGLFAVKDGKLIVGKKGSGLRPSGTGMGAVVITREMIVKGTCRVKWGDREKNKKTRGEWHDHTTGKREIEDADQGDDSEATYTHRYSSSSGKAEAKAHAKGRARHMKAEGASTSVDIEGSPMVKAGGLMHYSGVRPGVDGVQWIIGTAKHVFTKKGYRTSIQARSKDGAQGGGGGSQGLTDAGGGGGPAGSQTPLA